MRVKKVASDFALMPGAKVLGVNLPTGGPTHGSVAFPRYTLPEDGMNKGERAYGEHLETLRRAGEIVRWDFGPEKLRLADKTWYQPDFRVLLPDGTLYFVEIKGRSGDTFHATEDGWQKVKIAAELHPYPLYVVWPRKGGGWNERLVKRGQDD